MNQITRGIMDVGRALKSTISIRTARWLVISMFVFVALLEMNDTWGGFVSRAWQWIWDNVLVYKTVNFGLGCLTTYLLLVHSRRAQQDTIRGKFMKTVPIKLDLESLEQHAKEHGIELDLCSDPRISKRNKVPSDAGFLDTKPLKKGKG